MINTKNKALVLYYYLLQPRLYGALSSRPYSFCLRVWEHLFKITLDFTDSFGGPLKAGITNNQIKRMLNSLMKEETNWINDKSRFSYEGLFSEDILKSAFINQDKKKIQIKVDSVVLTLFYLYTHFNNHQLLKNAFFIFIFGPVTNFEIVGLLLFTFYNYSLFKIKTNERLKKKNELENNFQVNSTIISLINLFKADFCFLVGINTRKESSYLNLKLRRRYLKSNFNLISISSFLDLTFPIFVLGSTIKKLYFIIESNTLTNQIIKNSIFPIGILNSNYFQPVSAKSFDFFVQTLKSYTCFYKSSWNGLSILNFGINNAGITSLNSFSPLKSTEVNNHTIFYFLNLSFYAFGMKRLTESKVLNYLKRNKKKVTKTMIYQSSAVESNKWWVEKLKNKNNIKNCVYVPTENIYSTSGTYLTADGSFKNAKTLLVSKLKLKTDWNYLRNIFCFTKKKKLFSKNSKTNEIIFFQANSLFKFQIYLALLLFAAGGLTSLIFHQLRKNNAVSFITSQLLLFFFSSFQKIFNTKYKFWLPSFNFDTISLSQRMSHTLNHIELKTKERSLNLVNKSSIPEVCFGILFEDGTYLPGPFDGPELDLEPKFDLPEPTLIWEGEPGSAEPEKDFLQIIIFFIKKKIIYPLQQLFKNATEDEAVEKPDENEATPQPEPEDNLGLISEDDHHPVVKVVVKVAEKVVEWVTKIGNKIFDWFVQHGREALEIVNETVIRITKKVLNSAVDMFTDIIFDNVVFLKDECFLFLTDLFKNTNYGAYVASFIFIAVTSAVWVRFIYVILTLVCKIDYKLYVRPLASFEMIFIYLTISIFGNAIVHHAFAYFYPTVLVKLAIAGLLIYTNFINFYHWFGTFGFIWYLDIEHFAMLRDLFYKGSVLTLWSIAFFTLLELVRLCIINTYNYLLQNELILSFIRFIYNSVLLLIQTFIVYIIQPIYYLTLAGFFLTLVGLLEIHCFLKTTLWPRVKKFYNKVCLVFKTK